MRNRKPSGYNNGAASGSIRGKAATQQQRGETMGDRGFNAGGYAYMKWVQCTMCGRKFPIGNSNPRRTCSNKKTCESRQRKRKTDGHTDQLGVGPENP